MANLNKVIYLSNEDYETLVSTGTVTIGTTTLTYDANIVYVTPEQVATTSQDGLMSAADKTKLDGIPATPVTGVKGDAETNYRNGNVNITPANVGAAPTSHASSATTYGVGTTSNYGHVKLATGDMNGATGSDGVACGKNHSHSQYIPYDGVLMPTNPFGGKKLYINSIDNAFASADKKYYVTVTKHSISSGGVTYPYIDSSKSVTDDDYFVDGPVVSTFVPSEVHNLFNASYEGGLPVSDGQYMKIRIMFGSNTSPSASTSYFPGYPYGTYYLSYYYSSTPTQASQYRVYNKFTSHTVGWKVWNFSAFNGTLGDVNYIEQAFDGGNYHRTCIEFIIYGRTGGSTSITEVDYKLSRPNLPNDGSTVTHYGNQKLYNDFTWYGNHAETAKITAAGSIYGTTLYEDGTSLANKYESKGYVVANPSGTPTNDLTKITIGNTSYNISDANVNNKLDKVTTTSSYPRLYAIATDGSQTTIQYATAASAGKVVVRNSASQINVPETPTENGHAASKKYVDDAAATKSPKGIARLI